MQTLICIRQLPYAEQTIIFGGIIAQAMGTSLTLLTVIKDESEHQLAESSMDAAKGVLNKKDINTLLRTGDPLGEILEEAKEQNYDFIVVGSHDALRLLDSLLGTVTDKVAHRAKSSVLVVRGDKQTINRILIPVGGQKMNRDVVKLGSTLAAACRAEVTLLFVTSPVPTMYTGLNEMEETLQELLETDTPVSQHLHWSAAYLSERGVVAHLKLQQGVASDEIMREAHLGDYDLIVIGARSLSSWFKRLFLVDQVTPHVIERSPCSVLVVR